MSKLKFSIKTNNSSADNTIDLFIKRLIATCAAACMQMTNDCYWELETLRNPFLRNQTVDIVSFSDENNDNSGPFHKNAFTWPFVRSGVFHEKAEKPYIYLLNALIHNIHKIGILVDSAAFPVNFTIFIYKIFIAIVAIS